MRGVLIAHHSFGAISMFLKSILTVAALTVFASTAMACPDGQCKLKKHDIAAFLKLDGDKATQVREAQARHKAERQALKEQMHALSASHKTELGQLLSADEMAKVDAMMAEHKGYRCEHGHGEPAADGTPRQCHHNKSKATGDEPMNAH